MHEQTANSEDLHRTAKLFLDSGEATSVEDALNKLMAFRLAVFVGPEVCRSPSMQAAVLTIVNAGARSFLGGVFVALPEDEASILLPLPGVASLKQAVLSYGGRCIRARECHGMPLIIVGSVEVDADQFARTIRVTFDRWAGAVTPIRSGWRLPERDGCVVAGVLAASLAVSEVFQYCRGRSPMAMKRTGGLSLWDLRVVDSNKNETDTGPVAAFAPDKFWLIGLGNLGQAYLWILGLIPYLQPKQVNLTLQDIDRVSKANLSTSVLTRPEHVGQFKTRALAEWAGERGFSTAIVERRFPGNLKLADGDPKLALCGLDNALGRRALDEPGFGMVIEAGLGTGERYLILESHVLPAQRKPAEIWQSSASGVSDEQILSKPAYVDLARRGLDKCGLVQLASRAVGVPFVGLAAASLVISAALRHVNGGARYDQVSMDLSSPTDLMAYKDEGDYLPVNPGYQRVETGAAEPA